MDKTSKPTSSPITSLLLRLVPLLVFFLVTRTPNDNDMWWHLRTGQDMLLQHRILIQDQFSFTRAGAAWVNAFWLADIFFYLAYRIGGFITLSILAAALITFTMTLVFKRSSGTVPLRTVLVLIAAFGLSPFSAVRPQLFSFLFLAILDFELEHTAQTQRIRPALLIPFFILWANLHGGYFWGWLLLAAFLAGQSVNRIIAAENALPWRSIRTIAFWSIIAGLSTLINPNGIALWNLPFYTVKVSVASITEWYSPDFHRLDIQPILWLFFLLFIGLGFSRKNLDFWDAFKFLGFAYMSFISQRSIGPFLVIAVPVVSRYVSSAWEDHFKNIFIRAAAGDYQRQSPGIAPGIARFANGTIIFTLLLATLGRVYWLSLPAQMFPEYPLSAVNWIKANNPSGPVFNSYNWGGYLVWSLPEYPVFIDGRADLYGDELMSDWWKVANGTDAGLQILKDWGIHLIILEPGWPVLNKLPALGWQELYRDKISVIMGR